MIYKKSLVANLIFAGQRLLVLLIPKHAKALLSEFFRLCQLTSRFALADEVDVGLAAAHMSPLAQGAGVWTHHDTILVDHGSQCDDDEVDHNVGELEDDGDHDYEADHNDGEHDHLVVLGGGLATDPVWVAACCAPVRPQEGGLFVVIMLS